MSKARKKRPVKGSLLLFVVCMTLFCVIILLFSIVDIRRMQKTAAEPPPIYTGQQYAPVDESEAEWETLRPQEPTQYEEAAREGYM